jgi:hypothetical protein
VASNGGGVFVASGPKTLRWVHKKPCPSCNGPTHNFGTTLLPHGPPHRIGGSLGHPNVKSIGPIYQLLAMLLVKVWATLDLALYIKPP